MENIIENATVIYKNGSKKIFEAVSITEKGVYAGNINIINKNKKEFNSFSFIPCNRIQKIIFINNFGESKDIFLKNFNKEEKRK